MLSPERLLRQTGLGMAVAIFVAAVIIRWRRWSGTERGVRRLSCQGGCTVWTRTVGATQDGRIQLPRWRRGHLVSVALEGAKC
ncbi:hypothetical protein GCM10010191_67260 [Actinomadura vinacea]|uniref:Uncharacterized protein n=1 Tax=Actinomadura vinacea TaxID=115336 RepID=A0ABN3JZ48_9ACTN